MLGRWDAILLAAAVGGCSLLIENSHRVDTGAPDEEIVAVSRCDTLAVKVYAWRPDTQPGGDESDEPAQAPTDCTSE